MFTCKWVESLLDNRRLFLAVATVVGILVVFGGRVLA